jgi:hypothetical protein
LLKISNQWGNINHLIGEGLKDRKSIISILKSLIEADYKFFFYYKEEKGLSHFMLNLQQIGGMI